MSDALRSEIGRMPRVPTGLLVACLSYLCALSPAISYLGLPEWAYWALLLPVLIALSLVTHLTQARRERALVAGFERLLTAPGTVDTPRFDQNRHWGWDAVRTVGFWPDLNRTPDWAFRTRPVLLAGVRSDGTVVSVWRYPTRHFKADLGFWYNGPTARHRYSRIIRHAPEDRSPRATRVRGMLGLTD